MPMIQITQYTNERATTVERGEHLMMVVAVTVGEHAPKSDSNAMQAIINDYLAGAVADLLAAGEKYDHNPGDVLAKALNLLAENK